MAARIWVRRVLRAWESVQVELHGQYSPPRLLELQHHTRTTRHVQAALITLLTPLPCIVIVLGLEAMPLVPVERGLGGQNFTYWFRTATTSALISFLVIEQLHACAPSLPMTKKRLCVLSIGLGILDALITLALAVAIGFPVPFMVILVTIPWLGVLVLLLWFEWKEAVRGDAEVRHRLIQYLAVLVHQSTFICLYMAYSYFFTTLRGTAQTCYSTMLPLLKLIFKNVMSRSIFHLEDLAPTIIAFNVDVFHAAFVSSSMQRATTNGTTAVIMVVDLLQAAVASIEIDHIVQQFVSLQKSTASQASSSPALTDQCLVDDLKADICTPSVSHPPPGGLIEHARWILETNARIRRVPDLHLPRHLRRQLSSPQKRRGPSAAIIPEAAPRSLTERGSLTPFEVQQLRYVRLALKLLHMTEFYILIEFVEMVTAIIYYVYLLAMRVLPNRAYYKPLRELSDAELAVTVNRAGVYAALELVSFVVFCWVVNRQVRGYSSLHQIGFVLRHQWQMAQATLVVWICYVTALMLDHTGTDFSFRFAWLRHHPST